MIGPTGLDIWVWIIFGAIGFVWPLGMLWMFRHERCVHVWSDWQYPQSSLGTETLGIQERVCKVCKAKQERTFG